MNDDQRRAIEELRYDYSPVAENIWLPLGPEHTPGLQPEAERALTAAVGDATRSSGPSPLGLVLNGQRGAGKTHLLHWLREEVHRNGGYFFLVALLDARGFWDSVLLSILDGLRRPWGGERTQGQILLFQLGRKVGASDDLQRVLIGSNAVTPEALAQFESLLAAHDPRAAQVARATARALALFVSRDFEHQEIADTYFQCEEDEFDERRGWGLPRRPRTAEELIRELTLLMSLTGPIVVAVDQIDTLISQSTRSLSHGEEHEAAQYLLLEQIGGGLMSLRERTYRTLTVVACLPNSWLGIKNHATDSIPHRFRETTPLRTIPSAGIARDLVANRFGAHFSAVGFTPPFPTWPVADAAFDTAVAYTPRGLFIEIDDHLRACEAADQITLLKRFGDGTRTPRPAPEKPALADDDTRQLDRRFDELRTAADPAPLRDLAVEDDEWPPVLLAGLWAWVMERGERREEFSVDPLPGRKPPIHARLRQVLDEETEDQVYWSFRAIGSNHHHSAALSRLRKACTGAALSDRIEGRALVVLRDGGWSSGAKTREAVAAFEAAGGRQRAPSDDDLRTLIALRALHDENPLHLVEWLERRQIATGLDLFADLPAGPAPTAPADALVGGRSEPSSRSEQPSDETATPASDERELGSELQEPPDDAASPGSDEGEPGLEPEEPPDDAATPAPGDGDGSSGSGSDEPVAGARGAVRGTVAADGIDDDRSGAASELLVPVGSTFDDGEPTTVRLEELRKHVAIFAGSGSGKTVLIRRVVEECALRGVSAIVLDPNNDLARLGDPWPEPPAGWQEGDAAKAEAYLAGTEVVVWTPGRETGRSLTFQPLPDFEAVRSDPDEFGDAVAVAVASLEPRLGLDGKSTKVELGKAVLRNAVEYLGKTGGGTLRDLALLLSDLPFGVSDLNDAKKIGADLGQLLTAAMVNDPLFGGSGASMDPGRLLTPSPGKRARISVISFIGLPGDLERQAFVNQLQMGLFAWIRQNPAGDRPLGGLLVMDEAQNFAPSGRSTPSTESTLALASQARKYGLGLLFATQAPKGLHNRIPGNASTQFFGKLNAPAQVNAAKEMAAAKGGDVADVSRLGVGQFYGSFESGGFVKLRTPLCLTHHPASPLSPEEVVARARDGEA